MKSQPIHTLAICCFDSRFLLVTERSVFSKCQGVQFKFQQSLIAHLTFKYYMLSNDQKWNWKQYWHCLPSSAVSLSESESDSEPESDSELDTESLLVSVRLWSDIGCFVAGVGCVVARWAAALSCVLVSAMGALWERSVKNECLRYDQHQFFHAIQLMQLWICIYLIYIIPDIIFLTEGYLFRSICMGVYW